MKKLTLTFINSVATETAVVIDNKLLSGKIKKGKTYYEYETEKDEVTLNIFSVHEFTGKFWWLFAFIYYVISVFGLFNPKYETKGKVFNYKANVTLTENTEIILAYPISKVGQKALVFKNAEYLDNESNVYYVDEKIKKRIKGFIPVKIITFILAVVGVLLIILL